MRIYQAENYKAMSRRAANIISAQVIDKPNCVLGLGHRRYPRRALSATCGVV